MRCGILFLGLILTTENALTTAKDGHCSRSNQALDLVGLKGEKCHQIIKGTGQNWFKMEFNRSETSFNKISCNSWCTYFASCLNQNTTWKKRCIRKWRCNSKVRRRFSIITTAGNDSLYLRNIKVQYCWMRKFFAIKITLHNIQDITVKSFEAIILTEVSDIIKNGIDKEKMEDVFLAITDWEESVLGYAQYLLNRITTEISMSSEHVDIRVTKVFYQNESDFDLEEAKGRNFLRIPPANLDNGSVVLGVIYKDLHQMLIRNQKDTDNINKTRGINTIIMSATISPQPVTLQQNVTLTFRNLKAATLKRNCMFWNVLENSPVGWSGRGCYEKYMDKSQTECSCNHLTHFAVLMQIDTGPGISERDEKTLEILTYVGLTFSLLGIILTIISYASLTDMKGPLSQIRVSLVASLGAGQIIFLAGIGATENKGACVTLAALLQYFLMAAFCWMLVEGIYLYLFVVKVYNVSNKLKICHGISWGLPALIVAISLSIAAGKEGIESFVSDKYCWMSSANGVIWIFVVFVAMIELFNILILGRVIKEMTTMQQAKDKHTEQIRLGIRACVVMIPLLGVTWLFGLLSPLHKSFAYVFTIFNSTQGFLIFLLHCVRNTEIRARFKRRIHAILPAADDATSTKRASEVNETASGVILLRTINVQPPNTEENGNETSGKKSSQF